DLIKPRASPSKNLRTICNRVILGTTSCNSATQPKTQPARRPYVRWLTVPWMITEVDRDLILVSNLKVLVGRCSLAAGWGSIAPPASAARGRTPPRCAPRAGAVQQHEDPSAPRGNQKAEPRFIHAGKAAASWAAPSSRFSSSAIAL